MTIRPIVLLPLVLATLLPAVTAPAQTGSRADPCTVNLDALKDEPFVMAAVPAAGSRVKSGFVVGGCSRTFESRVGWKLMQRDGRELAKGTTKGGGVDGPSVFSFTVDVKVSAPLLAYLEVFEPSPSGKGPVSRVIVPLILTP